MTDCRIVHSILVNRSQPIHCYDSGGGWLQMAMSEAITDFNAYSTSVLSHCRSVFSIFVELFSVFINIMVSVWQSSMQYICSFQICFRYHIIWDLISELKIRLLKVSLGGGKLQKYYIYRLK